MLSAPLEDWDQPENFSEICRQITKYAISVALYCTGMRSYITTSVDFSASIVMVCVKSQLFFSEMVGPFFSPFNKVP